MADFTSIFPALATLFSNPVTMDSVALTMEATADFVENHPGLTEEQIMDLVGVTRIASYSLSEDDQAFLQGWAFLNAMSIRIKWEDYKNTYANINDTVPTSVLLN